MRSFRRFVADLDNFFNILYQVFGPLGANAAQTACRRSVPLCFLRTVALPVPGEEEDEHRRPQRGVAATKSSFVVVLVLGMISLLAHISRFDRGQEAGLSLAS
jgi:hypothetical protein